MATPADIGYARVSTADQSLQLQLDSLKGCARVFTETCSGAGDVRKGGLLRPGLQAALEYVREGDTLVVWKLDRLGRSVSGLVALAALLETRGVNLRSLTEGLDSATPAGRFMFHVLASLAQMERDLIVERTHAGLAAAKAKGRTGGRPPGRSKLTAKKIQAATALFAAGHSSQDVAEQLGVSVSTLYRLIPVAVRQINLV